MSWLVFALFLGACDTNDSSISLDGSVDATVDSGDVCACDEVGPCCDGCDVIGLGDPCASECSSAATCQPDGTCAGEADACDHLVTEPQCQAVTCDEELGCSAVQSIRQDLTCDDGDDATYDDRCEDGACVGTPCECDAESECCDGCLPQNEDASCSEPVDGTHGSATCQAGRCVGEPCECTDGPCCDGCFFMAPDTLCEFRADHRSGCVNPNTEWYEYAHRYCTGLSSQCGNALFWAGPVQRNCREGDYCYEHVTPACVNY